MLRILLVEDDTDIAIVTGDMLEYCGYHVTIANNGRVGLDIALQERPELIITDFMMPLMSGLAMIEQLRERGYSNPIILCSAIPEENLPAHSARYDGFLHKPYRAESLMRTIEILSKKDPQS